MGCWNLNTKHLLKIGVFRFSDGCFQINLGNKKAPEKSGASIVLNPKNIGLNFYYGAPRETRTPTSEET